MKALIVSIFKNDYLRDKGAIFWNFLFPLLLYLILVSIFGNMGSNMNLKIGIVGKSETLESVLRSLPSGIEVVEVKDVEQDLKYGKVDVCVVLPENFDSLFTRALLLSRTKLSMPVEVEVFYAPERRESVILANVVANILESLDLHVRKVSKVKVEYRRKEKQDFNYSHYVFPAILLVGVMSVGLFTVPYQIALHREQGVMKRLFVSPLRSYHYLISTMICGFFAMVISSSLITVFAKILYGVSVSGSSFLIGVAVSFLTFLSISLLMVSLFKSFSALNAASQVFNQVFMFMGGFYFDVSNISWPLKVLVVGNPATYLVDYLRGCLGYKTVYTNHFLVAILWVVVSLVLFSLNWRRVMVVE
ncbi:MULTISPECIES: ABC transporter permease [Thermotoga]|uniref:ABC-2 type transporter n=1 Tax=Thermotoga neapolitana (strain ATCC 49049 / DSM 4359 / NBRC 107923 / NS-E) TaxID=309803 RepID=B9KBT9_THENN|nr:MULTISPECIES: ABC transporter permease [Thermotoga]ACM22485.1 ABC-2 type transporter [Thermotoga neapolitana DSM 4359]AJG40443.1 ABC transporter [Thermotoga sp. RQ7]KFZ22132.1 ABC transporter [Thermotoga neapolitana LA10]HBF11309.1 ABC transporter permease [Thermotoga neapolitana]